MPDHTPEDRIHPETWTFRASATLAGRPETDPAVIRNWLLVGPLSGRGYAFVRFSFLFEPSRTSSFWDRNKGNYPSKPATSDGHVAGHWASATRVYPTIHTRYPATATAFATDSLGWPSGSIASVSEIIVAAGAQ